jgi:Holliday junction DNA helicase RuvA
VIGSLRGILAAKAPPQLLIEVGGVGYEVEAPMSTFYVLPAVGQELRLLTHLVVREDAHVLYGFATEDERRLFRSLLKVTGVGPKMALGILSGVSVDAFASCVAANDVASLTRIPGVGRKTAERLVVEMRDRVTALGALPGAPPEAAAAGAESEAFAALVALGYRPAEASRLVKLGGGAGVSTEEMIRRALQAAAREQGA